MCKNTICIPLHALLCMEGSTDPDTGVAEGKAVQVVWAGATTGHPTPGYIELEKAATLTRFCNTVFVELILGAARKYAHLPPLRLPRRKTRNTTRASTDKPETRVRSRDNMQWRGACLGKCRGRTKDPEMQERLVRRQNRVMRSFVYPYGALLERAQLKHQVVVQT